MVAEISTGVSLQALLPTHDANPRSESTAKTTDDADMWVMVVTSLSDDSEG